MTEPGGHGCLYSEQDAFTVAVEAPPLEGSPNCPSGPDDGPMVDVPAPDHPGAG